MTESILKIYVDQLRDGQVCHIDEVLPSDFLEVNERDLSFGDKVVVQGEAYLAENELILNLDIKAKARIPCSICNEIFEIPVHIKNMYHAEPLSNIKTGIFRAEQVIREAILLDVPAFAECHGGKCPARKEISRYLKKPEAKDEGDRYHPFADLDLN